MDKRKTRPSIHSSQFGLSHKDLFDSFVKNNTPDAIQKLQQQSNETIKKLVKNKRSSEKDIIKKDLKLKTTSGKEFGVIDEVSKDGIGQVKVISNEEFQKSIISKGRSKDQSEINALMHNSKAGKGYVHYVNEDNPKQQHTVRYKYDFDKYQNDLTKVKQVQSFVTNKMGGSEIITFNSDSHRFNAINESDFADNFARLQEAKSQSIARKGLETNNPFIRNMRRENRSLIGGMGHGWFGRTRRLRTPFGSSVRLGDLSDISKLTEDDISSAFDNQWGIDIETTSLKASPDSLFQVSLKKDNKYHTFFAQQDANFDLPKYSFLNRTGIGQMNRINKIDFSKIQELPEYGKNLKKILGSFDGEVQTKITTRDEIRNAARDFVTESKLHKKNIIAANPGFEINHFDALYEDLNPLSFSDAFISVRRKVNLQNKATLEQLNQGKITKEEAFNKLVSNQKIKATQVINDALEGGNLINIQELGKTMNAILQQKGLTPKTGTFALNTSVEFLAKTFLKEQEFHDATLDTFQQNRVGSRMMNTLKALETGGELDEYGKKYVQEMSNVETLKSNNAISIRKRIINQLEAQQPLDDINPEKNNQWRIFDEDPLETTASFKKEVESLQQSDEYKHLFNRKSTVAQVHHTEAQVNALKKTRAGVAAFGALMLGASATNLFTFSGNDDEYNTIEALRHGSPTQDQRNYTTSFGSGYRAEKFNQAPQGEEEQKGIQWKHLGQTGLGIAGAYAVFSAHAQNRRLGDYEYLGQISPDGISNEVLLQRTKATAHDAALAAVRRAENSFGGLFKAFGVGQLLEINAFKSAKFEVDVTTRHGETYAKWMDKLLKRKIIQEGVTKVIYDSGKLMLFKNGELEQVEGFYTLKQTVLDHNLSSSISPGAKSLLHNNGFKKVDDFTKFPFLIVGGKDKSTQYKMLAGGGLHETISKPVKLLADQTEGIRDIIPDMDDPFSPGLKRGLKKISKVVDVGLDGDELIDRWPNLLKKHAGKMAAFGTIAYFGLGTLNWGAQEIAPDGTPIGDAGLVGGLAYAARKGHELYARLSDITGLTSLRNYIEEKAPGSDGWQSTLGLTLSGAMAGGLWGMAEDLSLEATAPSSYKQFLENRKPTETFDGILGKIFKKPVTPTGKKMRLGGAIGFALALPFTIAGLGADTSAEDLDAEYSGEKEVAVKKGRFWEASFTPWEGGEIDYYRPNWYAKLMSGAKDAELYGENISPFTKAGRAIYDPYWLEKSRYFDQPYPITGPDGSMMGIFGPIYEATLGRVIKPVAKMHVGMYPDEVMKDTEYDKEALLRKQWNATLEFIGLRGFAAGAIKEQFTGSKEIFANPNEARSAKDIDSVVRDFYDLQIGGGILTSEALRRVFQSQDSFQKAQISASINLNPLQNTMPSWLPGQGAFDFKHGDPFLKVKDGYLRLPGEGFATRYKELQGVNPEDYPDIFKYKILSDVAYGSIEHRRIKGKLQNRELTSFEQQVFDEVQEQVEAKQDSEYNVRDPSTYDSFLGRYSAMLTDLARKNPLETLLPISPAHKFLAPPSVEDFMDEKRFSRDYRNWSNPVDDFIMPTVSMTLNNLGLPAIDLSSDQAEVEQFFDKVEYVKNSNLAREAQARGDLKTADEYTIKAQKTYTARDLYSHPAEVAKSLPESERSMYKYFSMKADRATQEKMLNKVNPRYRDAYQAQMDRNLRENAMQNRNLNGNERRRILREIQRRQKEVQARQDASVQDFKTVMPASDWAGWNKSANTENIKRKYLENKARDYHDYTGRRHLRISPVEEEAASSINIDTSNRVSYTSHYTDLNKAGIENALVVIRPGLDNSSELNLTVDRTQEQGDKLRDWGYIV